MEHPNEPNPPKPTPSEVRWAYLRIGLGIAQMTAASFSLALLLQSGMNNMTLAAAIGTCVLTGTSVLLFGSHTKSPRT